MLDRLISYVFTFLLIVCFVIFATKDEQMRLVAALILSVLVIMIAMFMNWLSTDGAGSSIVIGTAAFGLGGWPGAYAILFFFIGTQILSYLLFRKTGLEVLEERYSVRRDGTQVWSNAFVFTLLIFFWFYSDFDWILFAAMGAIAMSLSDTWASETGQHLSNRTTRLITTFKKVDAGTDGGISLYGTLAAIGGALIFTAGFLAVYGELSNWQAFAAISLGGFSGCIADSYLGAIFQYGKRKLWLPFFDNKIVTNNNVNAMASVIGAVVTLIILIVFEYALV